MQKYYKFHGISRYLLNILIKTMARESQFHWPYQWKAFIFKNDSKNNIPHIAHAESTAEIDDF